MFARLVSITIAVGAALSPLTAKEPFQRGDVWKGTVKHKVTPGKQFTMPVKLQIIERAGEQFKAIVESEGKSSGLSVLEGRISEKNEITWKALDVMAVGHRLIVYDGSHEHKGTIKDNKLELKYAGVEVWIPKVAAQRYLVTGVCKLEFVQCDPIDDRVENAAPILAKEEAELLALKGAIHYRNKKSIAPFMAVYKDAKKLTAFMASLSAKALKGTDAAAQKRASLLLAQTLLAMTFGKLTGEQNKLIQSIPEEWVKAHILAAFDALTRDGLPSLKDIEDGPARGLFDLSDKWWTNDTAQYYVRIAIQRVHAEWAREMEKLLAKPETGKLLSKGSFRAVIIEGDPVGELIDGKIYRTPGRFVRLVYIGDKPLSNIVVVVDSKTTGTSATLKDSQIQTLRLIHGVSFFGDPKLLDATKAKLVSREGKLILHELARNVYESMPQTHLLYAPQLRKGDVIDVSIGETDATRFRGVAVTAYSDQGLATCQAAPGNPSGQ